MIRVRVRANNHSSPWENKATPKDGFGPVLRGLTTATRMHRGVALMESTQVLPVPPAAERGN